MHEKRIEIRWRDQDAYGHVNNAVYLTYLEEARDEWFERTLRGEEGLEDFVIARVAIDFRRELVLDDDEILVTTRLVRIGSSSFTTRDEIHTKAGDLAAQAEAVLVARNRDGRGSRPLTASERAALEAELEPHAA